MNPSQARAILSLHAEDPRWWRSRTGAERQRHARRRSCTGVIAQTVTSIDGEGGNQGPDLTRAGKEHDVKWLHEWISDPEAMDPLANMPAFGDRLTPEELTATLATSWQPQVSIIVAGAVPRSSLEEYR